MLRSRRAATALLLLLGALAPAFVAAQTPPAAADAITTPAPVAGPVGVTTLDPTPSPHTYVPPAAPSPQRTAPAPSAANGLTPAPAPESLTTPATFQVTYHSFPAAAQAAFAYAITLWSNVISSPVPIKVDATWAPLGGNLLGQAGAHYVWRDFPGAPVAGTWYPDALADKLTGLDMCANVCPGTQDVDATFNSNAAWYTGTDGNTPSNQSDLVSVVLHEIGHGLGFNDTFNVSGGNGSWGLPDPNNGNQLYPLIFDRFVKNGSGQQLLTFTNNSAALASELQSNNLFFDGPQARAVNAGAAGQLFAPNPWQPGSSVAHWDSSTYPNGSTNSLMRPSLTLGTAVHDPGPLMRGAFRDEGWTIRSLLRQPVEFDGDGKSDLSVYRPSIGAWLVKQSSNSAGVQNYFGLANTDIPVPGDYDGDGKADQAVYRPSSGVWFIKQSSDGSLQQVYWGTGTDVPVPADYDGDGKADIAVYRPSTGAWFIINSSNGVRSTNYFGQANTDTPVPADYDGDGLVDLAVYRKSTGAWFIKNIATGTVTNQKWGNGTDDAPVPADYDGDGKADVAVFRPSGIWFVIQSTGGTNQRYFGQSGDVPQPGDQDGDGKTDFTLYRPSLGIWFSANSGGTSTSNYWGNATNDIPLALPYAVKSAYF